VAGSIGDGLGHRLDGKRDLADSDTRWRGHVIVAKTAVGVDPSDSDNFQFPNLLAERLQKELTYFQARTPPIHLTKATTFDL